VRGGAEAIHPAQLGTLAGRPFRVNESVNIAQKRAIAREAVKLCQDGDAIIINGGTTTFQMVHFLSARRAQVLTNSFAIAEHLVKHSKCTVTLPAGAIYREQNLILSPFENDGIAHFFAKRMFMGAQGISALGIMESDSLIIQSEQRLIRQAEELVLLIDSSKFLSRSSLVLCPLSAATTIITDDGIRDADRQMVENLGITLLIATREVEQESSSVA